MWIRFGISWDYKKRIRFVIVIIHIHKTKIKYRTIYSSNIILLLILESYLLTTETSDKASTSHCDGPTDLMTISTNDSGYNLWTSYVWGPVYEQSTKNSNSQK